MDTRERCGPSGESTHFPSANVVPVQFPDLPQSVGSLLWSKRFLSSKTNRDLIERGSIECRKTKTKVITLANQKDNPINQSKLEVITRSRHKARENVHARAMICFGFTSDWWEKLRENLEPITITE